ncbi:transcription intermediary factor 1-alpha-like [Branchiostoma lanceolatum]|uniref:transcription intermediary factor 1-alpha-like n=1 Tax=Branchiostoma lanceolatum TaxID=7740 RepID=UPI0034519CDF
MAENILSKISDDFLHCTICMEPFADPKVLSCLHTFCMGCLELFVVQQGREKFECPTCRTETVLPEGSIAGLKDNFFVVSLSDTVQSHKSLVSKEDNKVSCDLCEDEVAIQGCVACEEFLCNECACTHRRYKRTRGHKVVSVVKLKEQLIAKMRSLKSKSLPICPNHEDEKLKFYCETCRHPICRDCAVLQHKDHKYGYLADAVGDVRAKIKDKLETATRKIAEYQDIASNIAKKQSELDDKSKKAADDIDGAAEEEIKEDVMYLRRKQAELKEKLAAITTTRSKQLSATADSVTGTLGCLSSTVDIAQKVVEHGSDFDIMSMYTDVTARLDPLLKGPTPNIPVYISDVTFDPKRERKEKDITLGNIVHVGEEFLEEKMQEEKEGSQTQASFRFTVENFSQVKQKKKFSPTVFIHNLPWKILVKHEHDDKAVQPQHKKTLGVYLYCDADPDQAWHCLVSLELRLIPQKIGVETFKKDIRGVFFSQDVSKWGLLDFMPLCEVSDPQKGYIKEDKIVLEAYMKADAPHGKMGILRNVVGEEMSRAKATFRFAVNKQDFSANWEQISPAVFIRNLPWVMAVQHDAPKEKKPHVSVFLQCNADSNYLWSCHVAAELRLIPQKEGVKTLTRKIQHVFYNKDNSQGYRIIWWHELEEPQNGYIKEDRMIFEAYVKADPPCIMV